MPSLRLGGNQNESEQTAITEQIVKLIRQTRERLSTETLPGIFVNLYEDTGTLLVPQQFCFDYCPFNEFDSHPVYALVASRLVMNVPVIRKNMNRGMRYTRNSLKCV